MMKSVWNGESKALHNGVYNQYVLVELEEQNASKRELEEHRSAKFQQMFGLLCPFVKMAESKLVLDQPFAEFKKVG